MPDISGSWQFLDSSSGSKNLVKSKTASGNVYKYDNGISEVARSFSSDLVTIENVRIIEEAYKAPFGTPENQLTLRVHGVNWTGYVVGHNFNRELALDYVGSVDLEDAEPEV